MKRAKRVFTVAGIWGVVVLAPLYFSVDAIGRMYPPGITHPDFFFGFVGVALTWQIVFLMIGRDPVRLRPLMIPAMIEKFGYVLTLTVLFAQGKLMPGQFFVAVPDFALGVLFVWSFLSVSEESRYGSTSVHAELSS